ncbi:MAG: ABC transporter ATP-binding protein [Planctomycetota bacterium]
MSEHAVQADGLGKLYPLYSNRRDQVIDALGLCRLMPWRGKTYREFWALRGIDLSVRKGGRLGIVGSNGAGKSTLLKLIAGSVQPSEGSLEVNGSVQALMELGTGFHPEFTGRENIRASLRLRGLSEREVRRLEEGIHDFAELGEFLDQPLRTYSAGMSARLAFSTATCIEPEILIIDEVLGAGDAYFAGKCVDRMKRLSQSGATLLFVSHDTSAVEQMCDEAVWLDRGRVIQEAAVSEIAKGYAAYVREREIRRIEARNRLLAVADAQRLRFLDGPAAQLIVRLCTEVDSPIDVASATLDTGQGDPATVGIGQPQDTAIDAPAFVMLHDETCAWGEPMDTGEEHARRAALTGNDWAAVAFNLEGFTPSDEFRVTLRTRGAGCRVQAHDGVSFVDLGSIEDSNDWVDTHFDVPRSVLGGLLRSIGIETPDQKQDEKTEEPGTEPSGDAAQSRDGFDIHRGVIDLEAFEITDASGRTAYSFCTFEEIRFRFRYFAMREVIDPDFVVCIHRSGVIAAQAISHLQPNAVPTRLEAGTRGEVELRLPRLPLGKGLYHVSIGIFPRIDRKRQDTEATAYILQDRRYELRVEQPEGGEIDLGIARGETVWTSRVLATQEANA